MYYWLLGLNIILGVAGQFLIKSGVNRLEALERVGALSFVVSGFTSPLVLAGLCLYFCSAILWVILLSKFDLSIAYPALSLGYVLILLVSYLFLHEPVTWARWGGVLLIMGGIGLIFK